MSTSHRRHISCVVHSLSVSRPYIHYSLSRCDILYLHFHLWRPLLRAHCYGMGVLQPLLTSVRGPSAMLLEPTSTILYVQHEDFLAHPNRNSTVLEPTIQISMHLTRTQPIPEALLASRSHSIALHTGMDRPCEERNSFHKHPQPSILARSIIISVCPEKIPMHQASSENIKLPSSKVTSRK